MGVGDKPTPGIGADHQAEGPVGVHVIRPALGIVLGDENGETLVFSQKALVGIIEARVGEIYTLRPVHLSEESYRSVSPHHLNLMATLEIGKSLFPRQMPEEITIFAIGIEEATRVTEEMSTRVKEAIPKVVNLVLQEISL